MKIENRKFHNVIQGSAEWHALRSNHFTASEAAAMMGVSKYQARDELLKAKATGLSQEVSPAQQALFDRGHAAEASARPIAEGIIGDELLPATVTAIVDGLPLLASCDGVTMLNDKVWEHKLYNAELDRIIQDDEPLPEHYTVQMEQQLMLTSADKCLFMISDDTTGMMARVWYDANHELRKRIVAGWKQFAEDLDDYQHTESIQPPDAAPIKDLPAIIVSVSGELSVKTNFSHWGVELKQFISMIPKNPSTNQEFSDCKAAVAALKKAEAQLDAEELRVLGLVPSIDDMKREKKMLFDISRTTRLALEKLVVSRDAALRREIVQAGADEASSHVAKLNERIGGQYISAVKADFSAAIKGKSNYDKMRSAVSDALARLKIEANELADKIEINLHTIEQAGLPHLFHDKATLAQKAPDDLAAIIAQRVAEHERAEKEREERIKAKAEEDARRKIEAEQRAELAKKNAEPIPDANATARALGVISDTVYYGTGVLLDEDDLIYRLRDRAAVCESRSDSDLMFEAADEIERLRA